MKTGDKGGTAVDARGVDDMVELYPLECHMEICIYSRFKASKVLRRSDLQY